ncbi:MAG: hypothetical protein RL398_3092 [Planctomycetota bacterium]|jgi:hypothetical protein
MLSRTTLASFLLAGLATAQATHTQLFPAVTPGGRAGTHGVSDGLGMYVFGGLTAGGTVPTLSNEMWRFDGANWSNLTAAVNPPVRDWYASTWDAVRGRYVLFGGRTVVGTTTLDLGDTWEFDGTTWTQMAPTNSPSARRWSAMVFDPTTSRCILFGGSALGTSYFNDTWAWDGTDWTQLAPTTSPSGRGRGWLEWDLQRNRALYVSGRNTAGAIAEQWAWDGSDWSQVPSANYPGWNSGQGLFAYGMTYDILRDRWLTVGGVRTSGVSNQTWEYDGNDWSLHNSGPLPGRTAPAVAYVLGLGKTIVFGGYGGTAPLNDTWEYQTANFPGSNPIGAGCAGAAGVPQVVQDHPAWLGETYRATVSNLALGGLAVGLVGLSNTTWSGGSLPFPLLFLYPNTAANCQLLVSPDASLFLPAVGGSANLALNLPSDPAFLSYQLHVQAVQLDAALQLSVSSGTSLVFGAK